MTSPSYIKQIESRLTYLQEKELLIDKVWHFHIVMGCVMPFSYPLGVA